MNPGEAGSPWLDTIQCVDVLDGLRGLPDKSIDCVLTSPPYWSLRDYHVPPTLWPDGTSSILGLDDTPEGYVSHLVFIFDEVFRVLKDTGTVWINLADTYAGSWSNYAPKRKGEIHPTSQSHWKRRGAIDPGFRPPASLRQGIPEKSLCLIPMRFALAMVERGWILRNDICWHKPNHMPASVKDRLTPAWEHLFLFVKQQRYFFNLDAIREPHKYLKEAMRRKKDSVSPRMNYHPKGVRRPPHPGEPGSMHAKGKNPGDFWPMPSETRTLGAILGEKGVVKVPGGKGWLGHPEGGEARILREQDPRWLSPDGKNPGDCWDITTAPFPGAHFAVYPERLCERPILAGCPLRVCKRCGTPLLIRKTGGGAAFNLRVRDVKKGKLKAPDRRASTAEIDSYEENYQPAEKAEQVWGCSCAAGFDAGVVLDPFMGSGTTAVVAKRWGRHFVGLDANPDYVQMALARLANTAKGIKDRNATSQP